MIIETITFIASLIYILYIVYEKLMNDKRVKSFKHIIHVNGTRGKSTTCRLIDAGLRNCGWRVFSKTTGTIPTKIDVNGNVITIRRFGNANIREQLRIIKEAYKQKAEILIVECMAIQPYLQYVSQHKMLKADIVVITNVRHDHLTEMGKTLNEIAVSLANTIPDNGHLIVGSDDFKKVFERNALTKNSTYNVAKDYKVDIEIDCFKENVNLAFEVANILAVNQDLFAKGMSQYIKDPGALRTYRIGNTILINGLSINDPDSIRIVYNNILESYDSSDITILLNNRFDRPNRALQLIELFNVIECKNVLLCGSFNTVIKRKFKKKYKIDVKIIKKFDEIKKEKVVFAIGNIAQRGFQLLEYCEKNGSEIHG